LVGIVIVSHSETLANGVVAVAREMASDELRLEAAGGLNDSDPTHPTLGTDAERVRVAIEAASAGGDGVLVLMDLGSALMSAEFAAEMVDGVEVVLSDAPLVEGAVAAAAAASGGASLAEVAAEARGALAMKRTQLGGDSDEAPAAAEPARPDPVTADAGAADAEDSIEVTNAVGLHARPAARVVALARGFDAGVSLATDDRWVSAASLTGVVSLGARKGDTVRVRATGPDAQGAVDAFVALARDGFGDTDDPAAPRPTPLSQPAAPAASAAPATDGVLSGVPVSPGVVVGSVHRLDAVPELAPPDEAAAGDPGEERAALQDALTHTRAALAADRDRVAGRVAGDAAEVFDAHLALLDDAALLDPAHAAIDGGAPAARAWYGAVQQVADIYRGLDEPLLRERAADVLDVGGRVLAALTGSPAPARTGEGVVIAAELTPADAAALDPESVTGIATAHGSATAHAAILARALGLPAVVGLGDELLAIADGTEVLLDGGAGTLALAPDAAAAQDAREQALALTRRRTAAREHAVEPAVTRDGTPIEVFANLGGAGPTVTGAVALGAEGVGLLRTEFLYLDRPQLPSEDEQVKTLHEIARVLDGRPLVVRTLDAGADKPLPALPTGHEDNPFLGVRGVRLSLARPEVFATQLRAVLRVAAAFPGAIRLMAPMVSVADEVIAVRRMLDDARRELGIDAPLPFGIMVEVPAAALSADELAAHVDFFSIGTNDLTQYTMAAERGNERLAPLLTGLRPPVLELVRRTVQAAGTRPVAVCGELAGDPDAAAALVRAGVRELSMSPALIPEAKAALRELALTDGG
jgi:phosphocarrier protein FPr